MNKNIVLYGAGAVAEKIFYQLLRRERNVCYVIDNYKKGCFHGIPIVNRLEEIPSLSEYLIVVAARDELFLEIKSILLLKGFVEFENFIWAEVLEKKLVLINTNCYGGAVKEFLQKSKQFCDEYIVYPLPWVHLNKDKKIDNRLLQKVDLYIHQDIRSDNIISYEMSEEFIEKQLKAECRKICIPNLVSLGSGFFPTQEATYDGNKLSRNIFYRDTLLDEAISKSTGYLSDVLKYLNEIHLGDEYIQQKFEKMIGKIREREKGWDIQVSSFILDNYKEKYVMMDCRHPSDYLMNYICQKLANILELSDLRNVWVEANFGLPSYIWPEVKRSLQIWENVEGVLRKIYPYEILDSGLGIGYEEYIREYAWAYYEMILK